MGDDERPTACGELRTGSIFGKKASLAIDTLATALSASAIARVRLVDSAEATQMTANSAGNSPL
jgi:hypothetical protein